MRFVPIGCLREGMVIGKDLCGNDGILLLRQGRKIDRMHISRIKKWGYSGIYVSDELSEDIEIEGVIDENLRQRTIHAIKNIFIQSEKDADPKKIDVSSMKKMAQDLVDDILKNQQLMVNMIDLKLFDDYTYSHSVNVAVLSVVVGAALKFSREELTKICLGGLLHDIGKVFIPKPIVNKNGKLTEDEYMIMKTHSELGYNYLKGNWNIPGKAQNAVLYHHEKYDGTGYPSQIQAKDISLFGRIVAMADVYDALITERPYRKALLPSEAIEYLMGNSGSHFDPELVKIFIKKVAPFPLGTCVSLSNGQNAIVVENYEEFCTRPKVKLLDHSDEKIFIDLAHDETVRNITITALADL